MNVIITVFMVIMVLIHQWQPMPMPFSFMALCLSSFPLHRSELILNSLPANLLFHLKMRLCQVLVELFLSLPRVISCLLGVCILPHLILYGFKSNFAFEICLYISPTGQ